MRQPRPQQLAVSEAEILAMTRDLDEVNNDVAMPALSHEVAEWSDEIRGTTRGPTSRRLFLIGAGGLVAGGAAMAAVVSTPGLAAAVGRPLDKLERGDKASSAVSNAKGGLGGLKGDLAVAGLAASLENLAVFAYKAGIAAATAGKLGTVPPAVVTFATTTLSQHTQHAQAWNAVLTASGKKAVTITTPKLTSTVQKAFAKVTDVTGLAQLALLLENTAAQTYQVEASKLKNKQAISTAATIQPVEMQHAAILYFALGMYPGAQSSSGKPIAFNPTNLAA